MADSIHNALSAFRDTMLTAVARLEFTLRDAMYVKHPYGIHMNHTSYNDYDSSSEPQDVTTQVALKKLEATVQELAERMNELTVNLPHSSPSSTVCDPPNLPVDVVQELMSIHFPERTANVLVPSIRSTPALAAAVAAANVPVFKLEGGKDEVEEEEEEKDEVEEEEGEVVDEEEEDDSPPLKKIIIKGVTYYMDEDNAVYLETDDGYEQVGTYNPKTNSVEVLEDDDEEVEESEVEEEEEEAVEVEEFAYKGKTYQRDSDNNVYLDGEHIGMWNGKKIVAAT
jgi:hypothetical protein